MIHEHKFIESNQKGYEVCSECGTFHSIEQVDPRVIYEEKPYWGESGIETGRSTLTDQISNFNCIDDCGISKADRIMQFVPNGSTALEIACAPGVILQRLVDKGYNNVYGIEPSEKYIHFIQEQAPKANIINGYFPQVFEGSSYNYFDCIIGIDVMEHVENYKYFFESIQRLLKIGGTAVIMSPIILNEDGLFRNRDFNHPDEHCWIHTQKGLEPYLQTMFSEVKFTKWIVGHEIIKLVK